MKFCQQIAQFIQSQEKPLNEWHIIIPSERAKKYIQSALFEAYGHPIMAPKMSTIDQWVRQLTDASILDKTRLLLLLYSIHQETASPSKIEDFDMFMQWGPTLLSDIDEIDRYLLDPKDVFRNLRDIKEIEQWSFDTPNLSQKQQEFLEFWDHLPQYYEELNKRLSEQKASYLGKAYRQIAEGDLALLRRPENVTYLFAGFNALSKAEMRIMKSLFVAGHAHILLDSDRYYLDRKHHEAGEFHRRLLEYLEVKELPFIKNDLISKKLEVNTYSCAQVTGQVQVCSDLLSKMTEDELNQSLILLADEGLIAPLLKSLPKSIGKANISLGLPLKMTAIKTWVQLIFSLQSNRQRFQTQAVYHADVLAFLNHPFVIYASSEKGLQQRFELEQRMLKKNQIFININATVVEPTIANLFECINLPWNDNWHLAIQQIRRANRLLHDLIPEVQIYERALLKQFDDALIEAENVALEGFPSMRISTFKKLFNQFWTRKSMAYYGNPIDGVQIMGLLETRLLDFERIICLGLNEGKMPPTNPIQTVLPMDLRRYLGLPSTRDKQGLFAQHFYRLLHYTKRMDITYSMASELIGSNEESRYLTQLRLELERDNDNVKIHDHIYTVPTNAIAIEQQEISKTDEHFARLDQLIAKSFSQSFINTFLTCSLDFFYKRILEFGEDQSIEEDLEVSTLGSLLHVTFETLFLPHVGKAPLREKDIDAMISQLPSVLKKSYLDHFNQDESAFAKGKNLISFETSKHMGLAFLKEEKKRVSKHQIQILDLEKSYEHVLEVDVYGTKKVVRLSGIFDRIDLLDGEIRIIDYKSGTVTSNDIPTKPINLDKKGNITFKKHELQLMMYAYLYKMNHHQIPHHVGIYSFQTQRDTLFELPSEHLTEMVSQFEDVLQLLLELMYDPQEPFAHNTSSNYCDYCK